MIQEGVPERTTGSPGASYLAASIGVLLVVVGLCGAALADLVSLVAGRPSAASSTPVEIAPISYAFPGTLEVCLAPPRAEVERDARHHPVARRSALRHVVVRRPVLVDVLPNAVASLEDSMNGVELELGSATRRGSLDRIH